MNALIKFLIYTGIIIALLAILNLFVLTAFGQQVNDVTVWLLSSLLPWKNLFNIPALLNFLLELMTFETLYWGYEIANKLIQIYTGNNLHGQGTRN